MKKLIVLFLAISYVSCKDEAAKITCYRCEQRMDRINKTTGVATRLTIADPTYGQIVKDLVIFERICDDATYQQIKAADITTQESATTSIRGYYDCTVVP